MATVSIDIPDEIVPRLQAAMYATFPQYGTDGSNLDPETAFKQVTADYWRQVLISYESSQAQFAASQQVQAQIAQSTTDSAVIS
jgi:hypothetical protein